MSIEVEPRFIKHGFWTNVDQGPILGQTITTDTKTGNLIVALLAVLSTLATTHLWHLITFLVHQIRANGVPSDALFRQQQALLRTLPTPSSVVFDTMKLWWVWRNRSKRPLLRSLVLILVAIIFTVVTLAASIFSSLVVDSTNLVVLVDSPGCGWEAPGRMFSKGYIYPVMAVAAPYAKQCYGSSGLNKTLPVVCNVFPQREIPFGTYEAPCPFDNRLCQKGAESVKFDTDLIDVGSAFGLNLDKSDAVKFRRKTTCSILVHEAPWIQGVRWTVNDDGTPASRNDSNFELSYRFQFGTTLFGGSKNTTLGVSSRALGLDGYTLRTWGHHSSPDAPGIKGFEPIPELQKTNNSVVLIYVGTNKMHYKYPVNDPLFNATFRFDSDYINEAGALVKEDRYFSLNGPGRFMGCHEQYQFCYSRPSKEDYCTSLDELPLSAYLGTLPKPPDMDFSMFPEANPLQKQILRLLVTSSYVFNLANVPIDVLAGSFDNPDLDNGLPDDQWVKELTRWQREILASLQVTVADYAIGPENRDLLAGHHLPPYTDAEKQLCGLQKMRKSGDVVNIHVFGFSFIIAFSVLVAIIDISLLKFLVYLSKFRRTLGPRIGRWIQDGVWQLQRRAYEGEGHRDWVDLEKEIPLMEKGHELKDLPIVWRPEKSPMMIQSDAFASTVSISSQHPLKNSVMVQVNELAEVTSDQGRGWFSFGRH